MKKIVVIMLPVMLMALLAGAVYFTDSHVTTAKVPVTKETQLVDFHEARVAKQPDDPDAYRKLAAAYVLRAEATGDGADYDRALKALDQSDTLVPNVIDNMQARSSVLLSRHKFNEARIVAEQGLKRDPENTELLAIAGDGALQWGDLAAAEKHYRKLAEVQPNRAGPWARLSQLAEVRGDLDEAAEMMTKAIDAGYPRPLSPTHFAWARAILGEIELKRGRNAEARRQYMWALAKSPNHPLALEHLAELDQIEGDYAASEAGFRRILALRPHDPETKLSLVKLLERRGEREESTRLRGEARSFCEQAVASGNDGYLRSLATLELEAGNYERAAGFASRDLSLRPTDDTRAFAQKIVNAANAAGRPVKIL
ncbi:MAG: tetratricopeptide repeat protein [Acidobacteria bacterium]|nr:tetratricopeptide repeat protein [Acidobacteriota bacterium]